MTARAVTPVRDRVSRVANRHAPALARTIRYLLDRPWWTPTELADAARRGDYTAIIDRSGLTKTAEPEPEDLVELLLKVIVDAAATVTVPGAATSVAGGSHPQAALWARRQAATLITQVTEETRRAVRQIIAHAISYGDPPATVARDLAAVVGLDARSAQAITNYRAQLEAAFQADRPLSALTARFSAAPSRLPAGARALDTEGRVDALVGKYRDRLLDRRAQNIARFETQTAVHRGQDIVWQDALAGRPDLRRRARRVWIATSGACPICTELDGQTIGFDDEFTADAAQGVVGQLPPAHVACRCSEGLRFDEEP